MKYLPIENLLPQKNEEAAQIILDQCSNLIDKVIAFGTHVLKWEFDKNLKGDKEVPPLMFLRKLLDTGDAISILLRKSSIDSAKTLVRNLLETGFGLEYLIEDDQERRALSYLVCNYINQIKTLESHVSSTERGKQFKTELKKTKFINKKPVEKYFDENGLQEQIEDIYKLLESDLYSDVYEEFKKVSRKNKNVSRKRKNPNWYHLFEGPKDIERLAGRLKLNTYYQVHYREYSKETHSSNVYQGKLVKNSNGGTDIFQLRFIKDADTVAQNTVTTLLRLIQEYIDLRLPERKIEHTNWHVNEIIVHLNALFDLKINIK